MVDVYQVGVTVDHHRRAGERHIGTGQSVITSRLKLHEFSNLPQEELCQMLAVEARNTITSDSISAGGFLPQKTQPKDSEQRSNRVNIYS